MKLILILALTSIAFSTLTWEITYDDACTTQTAVITSSDSSTISYGNWMADCPSSIASPDDDSAWGCTYYAEIYDIVTLMTVFGVRTVDVTTTDGSETLTTLANTANADNDCGTSGTATYTAGSSTITCNWTVTSTNTFWYSAFVSDLSQTLLAATFTESPCGTDSSAFGLAGFSSAVLLF